MMHATKFQRTHLDYWFSGKYWYCSEKNKKTYKKSGAGRSQQEAFNDFLQCNNLTNGDKTNE